MQENLYKKDEDDSYKMCIYCENKNLEIFSVNFPLSEYKSILNLICEETEKKDAIISYCYSCASITFPRDELQPYQLAENKSCFLEKVKLLDREKKEVYIWPQIHTRLCKDNDILIYHPISLLSSQIAKLASISETETGIWEPFLRDSPLFIYSNFAKTEFSYLCKYNDSANKEYVAQLIDLDQFEDSWKLMNNLQLQKKLNFNNLQSACNTLKKNSHLFHSLLVLIFLFFQNFSISKKKKKKENGKDRLGQIGTRVGIRSKQFGR